MQLSQQALDAYRRQGYLVCTALFGAHEVDLLRAAADAAERQVLASLANAPEYRLDGNRFVDLGHVTVQFEHELEAPSANVSQTPPARDQLVRVVEPINDVSSAFDALLDDPKLVVPMQQLIGEQNLALWTAKLNCKTARCGSGFGWHQDSPYWVHATQHVDLLPNVMLALDDANAGNGCLRVIPGSHHNGPLPGCDDERQLSGFYTDPAAFEERSAVAIELAAGSCVFFDPHLIHGSGANLSGSSRRAVIATYQPGGFVALKSGVERAISPVVP